MKCRVKVLFLSKNAFICPYIYHCILLFVSSLAKMAKKQEHLRFIFMQLLDGAQLIFCCLFINCD